MILATCALMAAGSIAAMATGILITLIGDRWYEVVKDEPSTESRAQRATQRALATNWGMRPGTPAR